METGAQVVISRRKKVSVPDTPVRIGDRLERKTSVDTHATHLNDSKRAMLPFRAGGLWKDVGASVGMIPHSSDGMLDQGITISR